MRATLWRQDTVIRHPIRSAAQHHDERSRLFLAIEHHGVTGYGEVAPQPYELHGDAAIGDVVTVHQCHTPEIDLTSETEASGIWAMEDMLRFPDGSELHGYGHYHERYQKDENNWLIKASTLTRLRLDFSSPPAS